MKGADAGGRLCSLSPSGGQSKEVMGDNHPGGALQDCDLCMAARWGSGNRIDLGEKAPATHLFSGNLNVSLTHRMSFRHCKQTQSLEQNIISLPIFLFIVVDFLLRKGPKRKERTVGYWSSEGWNALILARTGRSWHLGFTRSGRRFSNMLVGYGAHL